MEILGRLPDEAVLDLYRNCRLLVFPGEEDYGIVPLEAQACGRPVVAYAKGGETDGMVYDFDLDAITVGLKSVQARVNALVREKAWEPREEGWFICGWFNWNESTATLREQKRRKAEGAAKTTRSPPLEAMARLSEAMLPELISVCASPARTMAALSAPLAETVPWFVTTALPSV